MIYNLRKFQVLYAIDMCNKNGIHATNGVLQKLLCTNKNTIGVRLTRYFDMKYVSRKRIPKVKGQVYTLTKKGINMLAKYMERFMQGSHLNLKYKPYEVDYYDFELLPGLKREEAQ